MGVNWTKEQEQVIQLQDRNILVSAAAGSGKTAVLVERILHMMTRKEHPVDIDRLLIVTFTRAAAGEMRERLTEAVEKRLEEDPENEHLQRQQTLIHNAQINTIDGFCSYVIRNYFHTIDLDPGFRTANEGELKLLKQDVCKELLEENYCREGEKNGAFSRFVEVFASGKSDDGLIELILRLYEFSMSNPWPKEWLQECLKPYEAESFSELSKSLWMEKLWEDAGRVMDQARQLQESNDALVRQEDGPYVYEEAVRSDGELVDGLAAACHHRNFDACVKLLREHKFVTLSRKKGDHISEQKREQTKRQRDHLKELLKGLQERYFYGASSQIVKELQTCREPVEELVRLTMEFMDAFAAKKRQKNMVDFSDMEHFALDILVKKQDGELHYTPAADEFSQRFEEILIDEYQDSNLVQETLLQSVSRLRQGKYNIFMVGDVKQSIYRFRLARPELFMEKYETYSQEESLCQRIDLHKNFRSRSQVLAGVNYIFEQIMGKALGDVEYDEAAALYPGAQFPIKESQKEKGEDHFLENEVLFAQLDLEEEREETAQEIEARLIGTRIREIVGKELVLDKGTGTYRPARYKDCVILLRTISGWAETFVRVLMDMGIPAYATSRTGYFSALEVVTVLNYLHILDNPMQEIPFAGVLRSPLAGCTSRELALLKASYPEKKIYQCAWTYRQEGKDGLLREKLEHFFSLYEQIRERVPYTPIHELIQLLLQKTGYLESAAAMPGGEQRRANLEMLVEKAMEYESTSYRGLFNFIRYMEQLQKYEVDFGEVNTIDENEDTVRIMSIHKSKGLEFPVVFASGMGKRFNMSDANTGFIIHPDLGLGMYAVDPELRVKMPTLMRQVMQKQIRLESLGEELRVLYVALTRAKEKLILTGTLDKLDRRIQALHGLVFREERRLSYEMLEGASDYWGWILPALSRHSAFEPFYERIGKKGNEKNPCWQPQIPFCIREFTMGELAMDEVERQVTGADQYRKYQNWNETQVYEESVRETLEEHFSFQYPYGKLQEIPAKVSISELEEQELEGEEAWKLYEEEPLLPLIPQFMKQEKEKLRGAERGTAYHRVMEGLDFEKTSSMEEIQQQMEAMILAGKLDRQMADSVRLSQVQWFAGSMLGQRMKVAEAKGKLWREQQFVMGIWANEQNPEWDEKETILIQGMIDAFFEEDGQLVLVDYKTDYVAPGEEERLVEKYKVQLQYYARALEQVRNMPVKEAYLYSFGAGKALKL